MPRATAGKKYLFVVFCNSRVNHLCKVRQPILPAVKVKPATSLPLNTLFMKKIIFYTKHCATKKSFHPTFIDEDILPRSNVD